MKIIKQKNPDWLSVTPSMMLKVLVRNSEGSLEPERKLWLAVLGQALSDTDLRFFNGTYDSDLELICNFAGLNHDFVRDTCLPWVSANVSAKLRKADAGQFPQSAQNE